VLGKKSDQRKLLLPLAKTCFLARAWSGKPEGASKKNETE